MSQLRSKVGQRIKALRVRKQMTQEVLAEKSGISVDFLSLIERGRNTPSLESLEKLAKALKLSISELLKDV